MTTIEREAELARLEAALQSAAGGEGRLVVIEGPPGIGKSHLLQHARARAKELGFGRLHAVGDEPEASLPWGVVRQLADRSVVRYAGDVRERILAGPTGVALRVLDEAAGPASDDATLARTLHKLWWVAADLSAERPLLITVDDAQWADLTSLRFVTYLARRLGDLSVMVLVATRPVTAATGPLAELTGGRTGERLLPPALSVEGVRALTDSDGAVAAALHAASGGNPFFTEQLTAELVRAGRDPADTDSAPIVQYLAPQTVSRALMTWLGPDEGALAAVAAVLGARSDLALAAGLAELDIDRAGAAADALRAGGVLADSAALEFSHPVIREAVLAGVPAGARATLHSAAARALHAAGGDDDRVAGHLLHAPPDTLAGATELLHRTGTRALAMGDAAGAVAFLSRAAEAAPPGDDLEADLGRALLRAGEPRAAREHLLAAATRAPTPRARADRLALAAEATAALEDVAAGAAQLRAAIGAWDGPPEDRLVLEARLALLSAYSLGSSPQAELAPFVELHGETTEERILLAALTQRSLYVNRPAEEVLALGRRALGGGALAADPAAGDLLAWGLCLHAVIAADGTADAEREVELARLRLLPGGSPTDFALIAMSAAHLRWRMGDLRRSETEATGILETLALVDAGPLKDALAALATRHAVVAQLEQGLVDRAAATLERYDAALDAPAAEPTVPVRRLRFARAALALARNDPGTALAHAQRLESEERSAGIETPVLDWRSTAAVALARLGRDDEARTIAAEQLGLARRFGAAGELGAALRVQARLHPDDRLELLEEAVAVLAGAPARNVRAGALADLGEALGVAGRRAEARERLAEAVALADGCGAAALARRADDGLAALGDRPRRRADTGLDELTASERRVAVLAADGRTNREIAQELFVTPKTVEKHLSQVYVKLGVGGRRELGGALVPA